MVKRKYRGKLASMLAVYDRRFDEIKAWQERRSQPISDPKRMPRSPKREKQLRDEFARLKAEVIRPMMQEIGAELKEQGHDYRIRHVDTMAVHRHWRVKKPWAHEAIIMEIYPKGLPRNAVTTCAVFFPDDDDATESELKPLTSAQVEKRILDRLEGHFTPDLEELVHPGSDFRPEQWKSFLAEDAQ